ncbi:hypothetical protein [Muricoccus radiodurans]|uniref:hypothetical protein n=1 Tax=Muricoccus radiodurans TaxID=2231721 RepID=UPI003CF68A41
MAFSFRGLELHGDRMWDRGNILRALDEVRRRDMTALVLHEGDLLNAVLFPRAFFDPYAAWSGAPPRRGENAIQNNRVYLDHVLRLADKRGVPVWLEIKELTFPDEVLEMRPSLIRDGVVCPSDPFWVEFVEARTRELFADFPDVAGLIVSPGSPEGRASPAQGKCRCERCQSLKLEDWYRDLLAALHRPASAAGKPLAVRDFAYRPKDHGPLLKALEGLPRDIILCAKVTPHDFYPTFPDNPAVTRTDRPLWIEYDVLGQFYGWGLMPCLVRDDIERRIRHAVAAGATGGVFRIEWERINDLWVLETANAMNLIAAAALSKGDTPDTEAICATWLREEGLDPAAAPWLSGIMAKTWGVISRTLYIDDFVFADCSMFPRSVGRAWWTMERKHSLSEWDRSRAEDLRLDRARLDELLAEKTTAMNQMQALMALVNSPPAGVSAVTASAVSGHFRLLPIYVEGLTLCAAVCLLVRACETDAELAPRLRKAIEALEAFRPKVLPLATGGEERHQMVMLMDFRRLDDIVAEARQTLNGLRVPATAE